MLQKSAEIDILELLNWQNSLITPYHAESKLKEVSKSYLHEHFCLHFATSPFFESWSSKYRKQLKATIFIKKIHHESCTGALIRS